MDTVRTPAALVVLLAVMGGCSGESTKGALYESLRFKSNEANAPDPNYNPEDIPSYNEYRTQREQFLKDQEHRDAPLDPEAGIPRGRRGMSSRSR